MERSSSKLYVDGWDWMDGWDGWTVVIGRRQSKSTFGANKAQFWFTHWKSEKERNGNRNI